MGSFDPKTSSSEEIRLLTNQIHRTLAHSYASFFLFFLVAIVINVFWPLKILNSFSMPVGVALLAFATVLIFWAQHTSFHLKEESPTEDHFRRGPYSFSRSPTHWGLFFLMLGFGIITNSGIIVIFSFIALMFSKMIFLKKEEEALARKYGQAYTDYKAKVRL